jgi:hypothetical protein
VSTPPVTPQELIAPLAAILAEGATLNFRPRVPRVTYTGPPLPAILTARTSAAALYTVLGWVGAYRRALRKGDQRGADRYVDELGVALAARVREQLAITRRAE